MNKLENFILNNKVFSKCNEEAQKEILEELESVKKQKWVTDRLPKKSGVYLVTLHYYHEGNCFQLSCDDYDVMEMRFMDDEKIWVKEGTVYETPLYVNALVKHDYDDGEECFSEVVAWMELPEPCEENERCLD